ncbi:hypothetical protein [Actinocorallia lasiicapitis]
MAEVVDVRATRSVGTGDDAHSWVGVVLKPVEILSGRKVDGLDDITVEFDAPAQGEPTAFASELREILPKGQALWFLHWKGFYHQRDAKLLHLDPREAKYYRLTTHQGGLAIMGQDGVVTPLGEEHPAPESFQADVRRFTKLSDLAKKVKENKSDPPAPPKTRGPEAPKLPGK